MKKAFFLLVILMVFLNCTTTELVDSWKNPEINSYNPTKVLVVGMTPNIKARQKFEQQIKQELEVLGIEVMMSLDFFSSTLKTEKMTFEELNVLEKQLLLDGFDTVLFTKVIGVEDKIVYKKNYDNYDKTYRRFKDDYLMFQDIYYNPEYYNEYTVYHAETSLYCMCPSKDRELIWKGFIDVVAPQSIEETVDDYINLLMLVLEEENLLNKNILDKEVIN